jgi:hypothetical protein
MKLVAALTPSYASTDALYVGRGQWLRGLRLLHRLSFLSATSLQGARLREDEVDGLRVRHHGET